MKLLEVFTFPFPFLYSNDNGKTEIILPDKYPVNLISKKLQNISRDYIITYDSKIYFNEFPIKDESWRNLYIHFAYDKELNSLFAEVNRELYNGNIISTKLLLHKIQKFLEENISSIYDEPDDLKDLFDKYIFANKLVNIYSIIDCCVIDEMGLYKLNYELYKEGKELLIFLQDVDSNKEVYKYNEQTVKLYLDIIKFNKNFCWYFGVKLLPQRILLKKQLESKTKISISDDIVHDWIPKIGKYIYGENYDIKTHKIRYPTYN